MTQFIAHAETPRTFSDKKGATKAIKRDLEKTTESLNVTGYDVKEANEGRFGVVVYVDLTPTDALKLVGKELEGYVIEASLPEAAPVKKASDKPAPKDKAPAKKRKSGEVNVDPMKTLVAARAGSKQDLIIGLLNVGATLNDLRKVCTKADGTVWDDNSIRSALYYDVHQKGYGVRTTWEGDVATYWLVLPANVTAPLPARTAKS